MNSARVRFYVRRQPDGRWTFGRQDMPFQIFSSKEAAVARGRAFVATLEHTELVVEDRMPTPRLLRGAR